MTWRVALVKGLLLEAIVVCVLALYAFGSIPLSVFGGVHISRVAYVLHLPGAFLSLPFFSVGANIGGPLVGLLVAAIVGVALQVVFLAALTFGVVRHPRISAAAALALVVTVIIATVSKKPPYPEGMDTNRDRLVSMEEWTGFQAGHPWFYGPRGSADYYKREFDRVDCNHDSAMDAYEYGELHWNLRTCSSPGRPMRPWWR